MEYDACVTQTVFSVKNRLLKTNISHVLYLPEIHEQTELAQNKLHIKLFSQNLP